MDEFLYENILYVRKYSVWKYWSLMNFISVFLIHKLKLFNLWSCWNTVFHFDIRYPWNSVSSNFRFVKIFSQRIAVCRNLMLNIKAKSTEILCQNIWSRTHRWKKKLYWFVFPYISWGDYELHLRFLNFIVVSLRKSGICLLTQYLQRWNCKN